MMFWQLFPRYGSMLSTLHYRSYHWPLLLCVLVDTSLSAALAAPVPDLGLQKREAPAVPPLTDFQVSPPILIPTGKRDQYGCVHTQLLMEHVFAFSYGAPFVGR